MGVIWATATEVVKNHSVVDVGPNEQGFLGAADKQSFSAITSSDQRPE